MRLAIVLALTLAGGSPAIAAEQPAAVAPPSPDAMAAAQDMIAAADIQDRMRDLMPRIGETAVWEMQSELAGSDIPAGLRAQIGVAIRSYLNSFGDVFTPDVMREMATIYARHFTADELRHLIAIMHDPVMLRYRQVQPDLLSEMLPVLIAAMKPKQDAFRARIRQIAAEWIRAHPADKARLPKSVTS